MAKKTASSKSVQQVQEKQWSKEYSLFHLGPVDKGYPYTVVLDVDGLPLSMEIDTGEAVSLMSAVAFKEMVDVGTLLPCSCVPIHERRSQSLGRWR